MDNQNQVYYTPTPGQSLPLRKVLLLIVVVLVPIGILLLLFNFSFIKVTIQNPSNVEASYTFKKQADGSVSTSKSNQSSIRKLVRRGSYEVTVRQDNKNAFSITKASGFMTTNTVSSTLASEKSRQFIGNNPGPCMNLVDGVLASYACNANLDEAVIHKPASANEPTSTITNNNAADSEIVGVVSTNEGSVAILKTPDTGDGVDSPYYAYLLKSDLTSKKRIALDNLSDAQTYKVIAYKGGFLLYSTDFNQVLYYGSLGAQPQNITFTKPKNNTLKPQTVSAQGNSLALSYSNNTIEDDSHASGNKGIKNEVILLTDNKESHYNFDKPYSVQLCDPTKLCLINEHGLTVMDISSKKAKQAFFVSDVRFIYTTTKTPVIVRDGDVLSFDVNSGLGSVDYVSSGTKPCGFAGVDSASYTLCVISKKQNKFALLINRNSDNEDSIDQKVSELEIMPEVKAISVYKNFIFLTPNLGDVQYLPETNTYGYSSTTKAVVNSKIADKVASLKFPSSYVIKNTSN